MAVLYYACIISFVLSLTFVFSHLLSQKLVKVVRTLLLEISFMLVRLAVRYLNRSLPNPISCVLDVLDVLVEDTKQPTLEVQHT